MAPKISVLMPVYNCAAFVAEAIESILFQTFSDFEFIIINDGSTDNTADIVREYAHRDNRIRFYDRNKNMGITFTLNEGLSLATGQYIARMDGDDICLPTRFEKQVAYMDANPDVGVLGAWGENFPAHNIVPLPEHVSILGMLKDCPLFHSVVMMRASLIREHKLRYDARFLACEDYELWYRMLKITKIKNLQEILLIRRWHPENICNRLADAQHSNTQKVMNSILNFITRDPFEQESIMREIRPHD